MTDFFPTIPISLKINAANYQLDIDPRATLLDAIRDRVGLTGTKEGM